MVDLSYIYGKFTVRGGGEQEKTMRLDEYLRQKPRGEAARLARLAGITDASISRYAIGERIPPPEVAAAISAASGGQVTLCELLYPRGIPEGATVQPEHKRPTPERILLGELKQFVDQALIVARKHGINLNEDRDLHQSTVAGGPHIDRERPGLDPQPTEHKSE